MSKAYDVSDVKKVRTSKSTKSNCCGFRFWLIIAARGDDDSAGVIILPVCKSHVFVLAGRGQFVILWFQHNHHHHLYQYQSHQMKGVCACNLGKIWRICSFSGDQRQGAKKINRSKTYLETWWIIVGRNSAMKWLRWGQVFWSIFYKVLFFANSGIRCQDISALFLLIV